MTGSNRLLISFDGFCRSLAAPLAAGLRQVTTYAAIVGAGREIEARLRSAGVYGAQGLTDRSELLWRTLAENGVDLGQGKMNHAPEAMGEEDMDSAIEECVLMARTELQVARTKLTTEIANYPTPIAGCDSQFNHLLSLRTKIAVALSALDPEPQAPTLKRA